MNGSFSDRGLSSRRAMLANAAAGLAIGGGALAVVTAGGGQQALAATTDPDLPWLVGPNNDPTGEADPKSVQNAINSYGVAVLAPGAYYGNATVSCNENQWVHCLPGVTWNLTATGIAAFSWTNANAADYVPTANGGITGRPRIVGPSGAAGVNPADGSIALQMGDIPQLVSDIHAIDCEYGLLLNNQNWWSEQGEHRIVSQSNTNPVVLQCAASGGSNRTGSFDRTRLTVYHNEDIDTAANAFGKAGIQLLAGASLAGGGIRQYGNFNTVAGTAQTGPIYALYVAGKTPAGASDPNASYMFGAEYYQDIESSATTNVPQVMYIGSGNYLDWVSGNINYYQFKGCTIDGSLIFFGPIFGYTSGSGIDYSLLEALWTVISPSAPGWSGGVKVRYGKNGDTAMLSWSLVIEASTVTDQNAVIASLPSGYYYPSDNKEVVSSIDAYGSTASLIPLTVNSNGLVWAGANYTSPSGGNTYIYGQVEYPTVV
jgi:hypothetical protein